VSTETLIENLKDIRSDAMDMLGNIEAVKGKPYALVVHSLLVSRQLADLQHLLINMVVQDAPQEVIDAAQSAWSGLVCQLIANTGRAGDLSPELLQDAMKQSDMIGDKFQGLIEMAIKSEKNGSAFGGRDAV